MAQLQSELSIEKKTEPKRGLAKTLIWFYKQMTSVLYHWNLDIIFVNSLNFWNCYLRCMDFECFTFLLVTEWMWTRIVRSTRTQCTLGLTETTFLELVLTCNNNTWYLKFLDLFIFFWINRHVHVGFWFLSHTHVSATSVDQKMIEAFCWDPWKWSLVIHITTF